MPEGPKGNPRNIVATCRHRMKKVMARPLNVSPDYAITIKPTPRINRLAFALPATSSLLQADSFQVYSPRLPIVMMPAVGDALMIVFRNVDVHQIDAPAGLS